jgi:hypothetical protein
MLRDRVRRSRATRGLRRDLCDEMTPDCRTGQNASLARTAVARETELVQDAGTARN